jgi:AcrR family transcriptional regulator
VTEQTKRISGRGKLVSRLMDSAEDLFFKFGIRRVTVVEICRVAGVSKMSFYRHFRDREEIAIKILERFFNRRMEIFDGILESDMPFEEKLLQIAIVKGEQLRGTSNAMIRDLTAERDSQLGAYLGDLQARQIRKTRERFLAFQESGHIRKDIQVDLIMYILEHLWEGMHNEKLLSAYDDKSRLQKEMFEAIYYGILPPDQGRK